MSDNESSFMTVSSDDGFAVNVSENEMFNSTALKTYSQTTSDNFTVDLRDIIGLKREPLLKLIPITIVYILIFVTGTIGNIVTCIVIIRNKYMHTSTNFYLFNLAIADLLVLLLGLPTETYSFWSAYPYVFGETFCIVRTFAAEASTYASILTITGFTVERYIAICHPLKAHTMSTISRPIRVIIVIWIISGLCATPMALQFGIVYVKDTRNQIIPESSLCNVKYGLKHSFEVATFMFFFTPMTMILVLYILIGVAIRRSQNKQKLTENTEVDVSQRGSDVNTAYWKSQQKANARKAVLKMLVAVVVAFFICWAPFHTQRLMVLYAKDSINELFQKVLYYTSGVLYYISSTINPILYNIMSLKFREAFKKTILTPCRKRKRGKEVKYKFDSRYNITETHYSYMEQSPTQTHNRAPRNNLVSSSPRLLNEQRVRLCASEINIQVTSCNNLNEDEHIEIGGHVDYVSFEDLKKFDGNDRNEPRSNGGMLGSLRSLRDTVVETSCTLDSTKKKSSKQRNGSYLKSYN